VISPTASCSSIPNSITVTPDLTTFEAVLQNETCNGPNPCIFRGVTIDPGSIAFASGALIGCPEGCGGDFRVARITLCAAAAGRAELAFQFSPPAPRTRDSEIIVLNGDLIQDRNLHHSYIVNVGVPTATPTPCAMNFSDVPPDNSFYIYIRGLYCRGAISGY